MPTLKISSCTVSLLDGSETIIEVHKLAKGVNLLEEVCHYVGITEGGYFGLQYEHPKDGKVSWFDCNKPLHKQLKKASHKFKLAVKFYPPSIHMLEEELTRYQFVLQIRQNLLNGVWSCSFPTQALLASYIVQAEFGNHDSNIHSENYLNGFNFIPNQSDDFLQKVHLFHKKHSGLTASESEWMYLETARKIVLYGMQVFDVVDGDDNKMQLAADVNGLHVLHLHTVLHSFLWFVERKKMCGVPRDYVEVQPHGVAHEMTVSFYCHTATARKRVTTVCNAYKQFAYHGKPSTIKTRKHSIKKKETKKASCHHISNSEASSFKRVGSKQFSQRVTKSKQQVNGSEPDSKVDENDEKPGTPVTSKNSHMIIPTITETLASPVQDNGFPDQHDSQPIMTTNGTETTINGNEDTIKGHGLREDVYIGEDEKPITVVETKNAESANDDVFDNEADEEPVIVDVPSSDDLETPSEEPVIITESPTEVPATQGVSNDEETAVISEATPEEEKAGDEAVVITADEISSEEEEEEVDGLLVAHDKVGSDNKDELKEENTVYDVDYDEELVVIDFTDDGTLLIEGQDSGDGSSLLAEIDKELSASKEMK